MRPEAAGTSGPNSEGTTETGGQGANLPGWVAIGSPAKKISDLLFALLILLMLTTPSWRGGTFSWLPLITFPDLGGAPAAAGILSLLPFAFVAAWSIYRLSAWRSNRPQPWNWGRIGITAPLVLLSLLGLASLNTTSSRILFIQIGGLVTFWLLYLYLLNERPEVVIPLALVVIVQGTVALAQFLRQSDLGLVGLGELPLDPLQSGVSVLVARDQRWLRGHGLTAHPNLLGAMITAILLLLLPAFRRSQGRPRLLLTATYVVGLIGLLVTFSRAAILAFIAGLATFRILDRGYGRRSYSPSGLKEMLRSPAVLLVITSGALLLLAFGDLLLSRVVALDSQIEAPSLNQRLSDWKLATELIGRHPVRGVGLGQYIVAAKEIDASAVTVHNVPLLVTAELGIGGLLALIWLTISALRGRPASLAPWVAVMVIGLFDVTLWLTGNWQTSLLMALIAANLTRDITSGPAS